MRRLGKVIRIRENKRLIVKANFAPKISQTVYDETLKPIGKVYDVFGPVNAPYVSVILNPDESSPELYLNRYLYVKPVFRKYHRKGRR